VPTTQILREITLGFVINPIAGMGGRVGLKGTDEVADKARALGATPVAHARARAMLTTLRQLLDQTPGLRSITWLTCTASMGADVLAHSGFTHYSLVYSSPDKPTREDTVNAVRAFIDNGVDIIVFCGGDGTARDICNETKTTIPR
jgi:predicted polyphosphate/ATP-dependent NAD kinase